jgi:hypothetical protein
VQNCSLHEEVCPPRRDNWAYSLESLRVSCYMNRFKKVGLIDYEGSLQGNRAYTPSSSTSKSTQEFANDQA